MKERRTIAERVATDYEEAMRVLARAARDHQLTPGEDESNMKRPPVSRGCGRHYHRTRTDGVTQTPRTALPRPSFNHCHS